MKYAMHKRTNIPLLRTEVLTRRLTETLLSEGDSHVICKLESDLRILRTSRNPFRNSRKRFLVFLGRFFQMTGKVRVGAGKHVKVAVLPSFRRTLSDVLCCILRGSVWSKSKDKVAHYLLFHSTNM